MGNVIDTMRSGPLKNLTFGVVGLGLYRDGPGTPKSQVSDGDTISSHPQVSDDLGVRFLGVDAPEKSFTLPKETAFKALDHQDWQEVLGDALNEGKYGAFTPAMTPQLKAHLSARLGANAATNHRTHALEAKKALVDLVDKDMAALGQTRETFRFYLVFASDVMDGDGRLLCYINRQQTADDAGERRAASQHAHRSARGKGTAPEAGTSGRQSGPHRQEGHLRSRGGRKPPHRSLKHG